MKFEAKSIPEGINTSKEHPLKEFFILLGGTVLLLAVAFLLLMMFSDFLIRFIPVETEQDWFATSRFDFIASAEPTVDVNDVEQYLQQLVRQLARDKETKLNFTIQLIDSEAPNAFIIPGGHIFVTTGLLRIINSENALSFVIAHEMAHQYHRHPIRRMGRGIVIAIALMMFTGVDGSEWVTDIINDTVNMGLLAYSREQERNADETGLELLLAYYGHAGGSTDFFNQLEQQEEIEQSGIKQYFSTHPNTEERIAYMSQFVSDQEMYITPLAESVHLLRASALDNK